LKESQDEKCTKQKELLQMKADQKCKDDLDNQKNTMNSEMKKEIKKVKADKDVEKKKELELHEVKLNAKCKNRRTLIGLRCLPSVLNRLRLV